MAPQQLQLKAFFWFDCKWGGRTKTSDFNYTTHVIIYMRLVSRGGSETHKNKHDLCMCILTNCSEHITNSVHLPSHFPILEGSGRGLEPRRLRGKDESPFRSRLAKRLGSHHSLQKWPDQGLLSLRLSYSVEPILAAGGYWWIPVPFNGGGGPLLTGLLRSNQHRRPDHLGHTFQRGGTQRHKERQKAVTKSLRLWTKMSIIWCLITRWRKGGEERARSVTTTNVGLHALCYGQSRPLWLTNFEEHKRLRLLPAPESYSPLNNRPGRVGWLTRSVPPQSGFWAPSLRLCQQSVVGQSQKEPRRKERGRQRERERDGGWGLSPWPPRGGAAWILQPRVRGREVVWRSTKEPMGARAGGSDSSQG